MSIKTRMQAFLGMEHRADGYTNAAIDALLAQALSTGGQPSATAAVATAVQAISAPPAPPSSGALLCRSQRHS